MGKPKLNHSTPPFQAFAFDTGLAKAENSAMKMLLIILAATVSIASPAMAQDYCRPKDGKDRIPKTGSCPSGYFASGNCCEAFRRDTKKAFPKVEGKACPSGSFASGGSCLSFR